MTRSDSREDLRSVVLLDDSSTVAAEAAPGGANGTVVVWFGSTPPPPAITTNATVVTTRGAGPRAIVELALRLRRDAKEHGRIDVVRACGGALWTTAVLLGAVLGAAVVCDVDESPGSRARLASPRTRALLRVFKPVMVGETQAARDAVPRSVPSVASVPGLAARNLVTRAGTPRFLAVNARYEGRPTTGVERYAQEITRHLTVPVARFSPPARAASGPLGHAWEQVVLPLRAVWYRCELLDLCNFGPLLTRRQAVVLHDIAPVDHPEWFGPRYRAWYGFVVRALYRRADHVVTDSEFTRGRLEAHWGPRPNVSVIPLGVADDFAPERRESRTPEHYVCFVGSIEPRKNLATLLDAMDRVRKDDAELTLVVVGALGPRRVFGDAPIVLDRPGITHVAHASDAQLRALVAGAECLVYPSHYEGFGLPPLEAMALGTPVVVSDIPVMREVCGDAARFAEPTSASDLAAAIAGISSLSPDAREDLVRRGRDHARTFRWPDAARRLEELVWAPCEAGSTPAARR